MPDDIATIAELRRAVARFIDQRDWRQFHTPKNLAMSVAIEAAELMEHFQWVDAAGSAARAADPRRRAEIAEEMADVCCYLLSLANALQIDLSEAVLDKLQKNAAKYPAETYRGRFE